MGIDAPQTPRMPVRRRQLLRFEGGEAGTKTLLRSVSLGTMWPIQGGKKTEQQIRSEQSSAEYFNGKEKQGVALDERTMLSKVAAAVGAAWKLQLKASSRSVFECDKAGDPGKTKAR